jgi:hypothetical protein
VFKRFGLAEPQVVSLTDCEQRPNPAALAVIGALAVPQPAHPEGTEPPLAAADGEQAPKLNPQLLVRLQQVASRFPDRAIEIVSGYRTRARATSRHRSGDALDLRVEGIDNEELSIFARTLEETGVGYYPNSTFVHIDVRAGSAYWVDRSAPGQRPDYVRAPPGAVSVPEAVLANTPAETERDLLSAQLARSLLDVHGPELPVHTESDSPDEPTPAAEPTPATTVEPQPAGEQSSPAEEAPDADEPSPPSDAAGGETDPPARQPAGDIVEAAAEPATEAEEAIDAALLDAEIQTLLERALVVMAQANAAG